MAVASIICPTCSSVRPSISWGCSWVFQYSLSSRCGDSAGRPAKACSTSCEVAMCTSCPSSSWGQTTTLGWYSAINSMMRSTAARQLGCCAACPAVRMPSRPMPGAPDAATNSNPSTWQLACSSCQRAARRSSRLPSVTATLTTRQPAARSRRGRPPTRASSSGCGEKTRHTGASAWGGSGSVTYRSPGSTGGCFIASSSKAR